MKKIDDEADDGKPKSEKKPAVKKKASKKKTTKKKVAKKTKIVKNVLPPTVTIRLTEDGPVKVKVITMVNDLIVEHVGYLADDSIVTDSGVILSSEVDGYPFIEIDESTIVATEFFQPSTAEVKKLTSVSLVDYLAEE